MIPNMTLHNMIFLGALLFHLFVAVCFIFEVLYIPNVDADEVNNLNVSLQYGVAEAVCPPADSNTVTDYITINETQYDRNYSRLGSGNNPLGFYVKTWHYNQGTANPCIRITAPDARFRRLEIKVETVPPSRICVKDQNSNNLCFQDRGTDCRETQADTIYIEFLCDGQCEEADVNFWYRLALSPLPSVQDPEMWCAERPSEYPGDLATLPPGMTLPVLTTPAPRDDTGTAVATVPPTALVAALLMVVHLL